MGKAAFKYSSFALILFLVAMLSYGLGATRGAPLGTATAAAGPVPNVSAAESKQFRLVDEAYQILKEDYVDRDAITAKDMTVGAIKGMVESLGDPHTTYIDAESFRLDRNAFEGSFQGIGATVSLNNGKITIIAPIKGSPAERAGIRPGDVILEIDGQSTQGMSLADAVLKIRGQKGSKVTLTILHEGSATPEKIEIIRDDIKTESVFVRHLPNNIDHVLISQFTNRTNEELTDVLRAARQNGVKGIVLDLRGNPGGLLEETVQVTSQFLKDGVVLYEVDKDGQRRTWNVRPGGLATDIPLTVLVNKGSASGSEVVAGAIQDAKRAPLIGTATFGKGAVNHVRELSDHSALYVTIARWFTPKNRQIEGDGLKPDIEVPLTEEQVQAGQDVQLNRALEYLKANGVG